MSYDILTVGDMNVDLLVSPNAVPQFGQVEKLVEHCFLTTGGSANIFASQFARLGGRIAVLGKVGNDAFGAQLLDELKAAGVDVSLIVQTSTLNTGISICLINGGDRAILTYPGSIHGVSPDDLAEEHLRQTRHWHIASFYLLERLLSFWPSWCHRLKENGVTISLDTNWDPHERWESARKLLPLVDVFLPNEAEARAISGYEDTVDAGKALTATGPLVVIKRGPYGAVAFHGDKMLEVPPYRDEPPVIVDSVGAGDCFDAGFLRGWLKGKSLRQSINLGNKCGYHSLQGAGGVTAQLQESVA